MPSESIDADLPTLSLPELRQRALAHARTQQTPRERRVATYVRSQAIKLYALRRATGHCEGCQTPAPFLTKAGDPYLEVHHVRRLSDGGPDHPRWVIAICPTCHRRAHYASDGDTYNAYLTERIGQLEAGRS